MATSYIPNSDSGFSAWLANFSALLTASPTTYGLIAGDATIVAAENTDFQAAYALTVNPATRTAPTIAAKDAAKVQALQIVRPYAVLISLNSGVTDEAKTDIGVTVRKLVPTPVPPPLTVPGLALVAASPGQHQLRYFDTSTPTTKAKPPGAIGLQVFRSVGVAPSVDPSAAVYYDTWTKSPNVSAFDPSETGKVATYWARWVTRGGPGGATQVGPWGAPLALSVM
jgi:hypothetical protein